MADLTLLLTAPSQGTAAHNDLVLGPTGDLQLTNGVQAIEQAIRQAISSFQGNWFLDTSYGLPYFDELLGSRNQSLTPNFESRVQNTILGVPGVEGLLTWSAQFHRASRTLAISFTAQVTGGTVAFDNALAI